jgi:hypothetical protein
MRLKVWNPIGIFIHPDAHAGCAGARVRKIIFAAGAGKELIFGKSVNLDCIFSNFGAAPPFDFT